MLNTTNSNSEYLHNYIRKVAKQEQGSVDTSNVYTGTVEAAQSGIYTIVLNQSDKSSSVLAIPIVTGDVYDKDDSVYLLMANTTATVNYFIVGKVNAIQEAFFNLTELERFNPNESKVDLDFKNGNEINIKDNENNIFDNISILGYFQLEVKITSKVEDNDKINIYLNYSEGQYAAKFVFSSYEFIGQPGGDSYTLIQKKIFHLPSNIDIENIRIEKVGDFSVEAMHIVAGSLLEISAAYQNSIAVQNDRNYFEKEMPNSSNSLNAVTLTSKVYYNNKPLVGDALQYYWLLKDDNATNSASFDYLKNIEGAGNGWRCLNTFTSATAADGEGIRLWDNKNNFITLNKKNFIVPNEPNKSVNFSNFVNKIKCIVKYFDNFIESDLIDIYNYDYEQFSATLTTNVDPIVIINREDAILLECKVANNNSKIDLNNFVYKYEWHLGDTILSNLKDGLIKVQDKTSTTLEEKEKNVREMENDIEEYYCKVSIYHKNDTIDGEVIEGKQPISEEISNTIQVTSAAAATDIQEEVQYKYYIANNHRVTFKENVQTSENTGLSEWSGDWDIYDSNVDSPVWLDGSFDKVFNDLDLFSNKAKTKEYFIYYTKRTVVRQGLEILRKEIGSFPQIARSVIYGNGGWKNHRIGDSVNQLNTFNQLTNNGKDDGIYYSDVPLLISEREKNNPDSNENYYIKNQQGRYDLINLNIDWSFKPTLEYYVFNSSKQEYYLISTDSEFIEGLKYYEKIITQNGDTQYIPYELNTNNFNANNVTFPNAYINQDIYKNIDNKLFINATYIRSGTLEVKDKFYASIDQDDVRIAGFNVDDTTFQSKNGTVGLNSDKSQKDNVAIWAGTKNGDKYPFQVTHNGVLHATGVDITGKITVGDGSNVYTKVETNEQIDQFAAQIVIGTGDYASTDNSKGQYAYLKTQEAEFLQISTLTDEVKFKKNTEDYNPQQDYYVIKGEDLYLPVILPDLNKITDYYIKESENNSDCYGAKGALVIDTENFKLDEKGNLKANNGIFSGEIKSSNLTYDDKEDVLETEQTLEKIEVSWEKTDNSSIIKWSNKNDIVFIITVPSNTPLNWSNILNEIEIVGFSLLSNASATDSLDSSGIGQILTLANGIKIEIISQSDIEIQIQITIPSTILNFSTSGSKEGPDRVVNLWIKTKLNLFIKDGLIKTGTSFSSQGNDIHFNFPKLNIAQDGTLNAKEAIIHGNLTPKVNSNFNGLIVKDHSFQTPGGVAGIKTTGESYDTFLWAGANFNPSAENPWDTSKFRILMNGDFSMSSIRLQNPELKQYYLNIAYYGGISSYNRSLSINSAKVNICASGCFRCAPYKGPDGDKAEGQFYDVYVEEENGCSISTDANNNWGINPNGYINSKYANSDTIKISISGYEPYTYNYDNYAIIFVPINGNNGVSLRYQLYAKFIEKPNDYGSIEKYFQVSYVTDTRFDEPSSSSFTLKNPIPDPKKFNEYRAEYRNIYRGIYYFYILGF